MPGVKEDGRLLKYTTKVPLPYPAASGAVTLTTGTGTWVYGDYVQIVPVNTITSNFLILAVILNFRWGAFDEWEVTLAKGAVGAEVVVAVVPFVQNYASDAGYIIFPSSSLVIPVRVAANSRISAKVARKVAASTTATFKLFYIPLPL